MRRFLSVSLLRLALAFAVPAALLSAPSPAFAQAGAVVEGITFEGNTQYRDETLLLQLKTKVGEPLDRAALSEDVNTLYRFFDTVDLREEPTGKGVNLVFVVTENPLVTDVRIVGVNNLTEKEVRELLDTRSGRPLAGFRIENDRRKVERHAKRSGYHWAEVTHSVEEHGRGKRVTFRVNEGPRVSVDKIEITGNRSIESDVLKDDMNTQESGWINLAGRYFVQEALDLDLLAIKGNYRAKGWLDAEVDLDRLDFNAERNEAKIRIAVSEGARYRIGKVTIEGAEGYPGGAQALEEFLRVETGEPRLQEDVSRTRTEIERAYREEGYFAARVLPEEKLSADEAVVDLIFRIEEEAKVKVRKLDIVGNTITRDKVIRREISVLPGDVLNQNEIEKSLRRLNSLRYFTRVAHQVKELPEDDNPDDRDVEFQVDDGAPTGRARFAVGVSSDLGVSATFSVTKRNFDYTDWPERFGQVFDGSAFTGGGQTFGIELSPGTDYSNYRLSYTQPWLFDKPISFGWDLFLQQFTRFDYDVDRTGVNFTLGRRFTFPGKKRDTVLGISGTTRIESTDVSNLSRDASPTAFLAKGDLSLIAERFTVSVDRRDSTASPTKGWLAQFSTEVGFAGDTQLTRTEISGAQHFLLYTTNNERHHVLTLKGRFAYADFLSGSETADPNILGEGYVPVYERYSAGGISTVRGFEYGSVGPKGEGDPRRGRLNGESAVLRNRRLGETADKITNNDGEPLGGDIMLVGSAEYAFPLYENTLRGVLFVDAGTVRESGGSAHGLGESEFNRIRNRLLSGPNTRNQDRAFAQGMRYENEDSFFGDVRVSAGFGLRIKLPFFGQTPIALDFAFVLRDQDGDDRQVFNFSLSRDF